MRPFVQWDDACVVDLLVENRHESGRRHNLSPVVVARGEYGACQPARDATDVEVKFLPRCRRCLRTDSRLPDLRLSLSTFGRQWRHISVRRIHDERRLPRGPSRPLSPTNSWFPRGIAKARAKGAWLIPFKGPLKTCLGLLC